MSFSNRERDTHTERKRDRDQDQRQRDREKTQITNEEKKAISVFIYQKNHAIQNPLQSSDTFLFSSARM